jgi:pyruvate dehydrogenase E2 component (dihydrolipoamide acetyltransferase)
MVNFLMPSLGADMLDGTLIEWKVKPGDKVKRGDIIAVVETQKGLIDIEVFEEGTIGGIILPVGTKVPVGSIMAEIIQEGDSVIKEKLQPIEVATVAKNVFAAKPEISEDTVMVEAIHSVKASPLAKKIASERGIDLSSLVGTGQEGVIVKADVEKAISEMRSHLDIKKRSTVVSPSENIRSAVAAAMSLSNREIPHYYLETKIDMKASLEMLQAENLKLSVKERMLPAVLLIKAVAKALKEVPELNAWWVNGNSQKKNDIHIGFVVSLRAGGILVPAIHDSEKKTLTELMQSLNDIIPRARAMKLRSSELSDSTITVTSLGEEGVETVFGIIYPPQVALVGFGKISDQVLIKNGMIAICPVLVATLSADHRATDGSTGSRFLLSLKNYLEHPELL